MMHLAKRMQPLQTNVFADMDRAKAKARATGQTVIDLSSAPQICLWRPTS